MRIKPLLFAVGAVALILVGMVVFKGPQPHVILAAERVFSVGGIWITNTVITGFILVIILSAFLLTATRSMALVPSGLQNLVEALVEWALDMVEGIAGHENGRRFFPLIFTIFIYVMVGNWMGLLPGLHTIGLAEHADHGVKFVNGPLNVAIIPLNPEEVKGHGDAGDHGYAPQAGSVDMVSADPSLAHVAGSSAAEEVADGEFVGLLVPLLRAVNTDVNMTLAIALISFVFVEFWGLKSLGIGYLGKFFAFGSIKKNGPMGLIDVFVGFLELISEFIRIVSFTFRLFGNIFAGEVLVAMMVFLVPFLFALPFYFLEVFVGFIQAAVFALLTLVFATMAVESHAEHEPHEEHAGHAAAPAH